MLTSRRQAQARVRTGRRIEIGGPVRGFGIVSRQFGALFLDGLGHVASAGRAMAAVVGVVTSVVLGQARQRLAGIDPTAVLIGSADAVEAGFAKLSAAARRLIGRRGLGLTGGLLWRGLAALTGIGLTGALVTLMSEPAESSLASLTLQPMTESRPIRDVRQDPRPSLADDGAWVAIARPVAMFGLDSPELERQAPIYEAQRSQTGARRRDNLSFGGFTETRPHLQLRLLVDHATRELPQPFVIALVREAAEHGMSVQRGGQASAIATRFGPVETSDATLSDGAASRACIAFRKSPGELPLGLSGWWCGSPGRPADRQQLICLIDRIDLLSAADDRVLRTTFARSELTRQPACASPRLAASGQKASWLDADGHTPALKAAARR